MEHNINDLINSRGVPEPLRDWCNIIASKYAAAQEELAKLKAAPKCGRCGKHQIAGIHTCTPTAWARKMEEEMAKLRDHVASLEQYEPMVLEACGELETFAEYRQAMAKLREDAKRLDWIARQGDEFTSCILVDQPGDGSYFVSGFDSKGQGKTFREAIDAARKETK